MSELTPEDDSLLSLARGACDGSEEDRLRVRRKLALQLAAGATASVAVAPASGKVAAWLGTSMKFVATLVAGTAIAAGVMAARGDWRPHAVKKEAPPTASMSTTAPTTMAPTTSTPIPTPNAARIPFPTTIPIPITIPTSSPTSLLNLRTTTQPSSAPAVAAFPSPPGMSLPTDAAPLASSRPVVPDVGTEALLLRQAGAALRAGNPKAALELLDKHASTFPNGALREEREVERIVVLCALGRAEDARAMSALFLRNQPHSPLAARVRASCGGS